MSRITEIKNKWRGKIDNLDLDCILTHVLGKTRAWLYAHSEHECRPTQNQKINALIRRRAQGEPLAYLTGHKEFFGLDFFVNKYTLIPRPETEMLVEEILKNKDIKTIADIGTGSGCIAVALAKNNPKLKIYAVDISAPALKIARKNAKKHDVEIIFKQGNLRDPIKNISLDVIVANLPYVPDKLKKKTVTPKTRALKFEPARALYAGPRGLDVFEQFFQQLQKIKHQPKYIYLEIGHDQARALKKLAQKFLPKSSVQIKTDLASRDRLMIIETSS